MSVFGRDLNSCRNVLDLEFFFRNVSDDESKSLYKIAPCSLDLSMVYRLWYSVSLSQQINISRLINRRNHQSMAVRLDSNSQIKVFYIKNHINKNMI